MDPRQLSLRNSLGFAMTPVQARDGIDRADAMPAGAKVRPPRAVGFTWPTAAAHLGAVSGVVKRGKCRLCDVVGHDLFECPKHFFETFRQPMPGYDREGARSQNYWHDGQEANGPSRTIALAWAQHDWRQDIELDGPEHIVEAWRICAARVP